MYAKFEHLKKVQAEEKKQLQQKQTLLVSRLRALILRLNGAVIQQKRQSYNIEDLMMIHK